MILGYLKTKIQEQSTKLPLLFMLGYFGPAGDGFGEFFCGEALDDELLALDPVCVSGLVIEVSADGRQRPFTSMRSASMTSEAPC